MKIKFVSIRTQYPLLQLAGFILIAVGVVFLLYKLIAAAFSKTLGGITGTEISISFFIIMLGISFIFPDMLKGKTQDVSTMRIVVFMMINVICLLLLKLGWDQHNLADIGLNEYWMGVIAFVFGAKATQSYFESKMAVPPATDTATLISQPDLAKLAISQHEQLLKAKFPNIASISDAVHDLKGAVSHVVAIYLKDNNTAGLPTQLEVTMPDNTKQSIDTEVIRSVGTGSIQVDQRKDSVSDAGSITYQGSVCCLVKSATNPNFIGLVTSGHVYSNGNYVNRNGILAEDNRGMSRLNGQNAGPWYLQIIDSSQDIAVADISGMAEPTEGYIQVKDYHEVTDKDVGTPLPNVTLIAKSHKADAFIIDYNVAFDIDYSDVADKRVNNIILIGTDKVRESSKPVSGPGDSGCCIVEKATGRLVGILLGGNDKYSFVLPIKKTLESYSFKPL